ncbi:MAG: response regulator [Bdellovibrionota bacterium]
MAKTVLIVDDIPFVRKTLTQILSDAKYHVIGEATDGAQAVEMYAKLHPDIVTMDIVMPRMSGIDATRKIVQADKNAKVVIITAMGQENLVMEAINAGAKDYVLKPFSAIDVIRTVERVIADEPGQFSRPTPREQRLV